MELKTEPAKVYILQSRNTDKRVLITGNPDSPRKTLSEIIQMREQNGEESVELIETDLEVFQQLPRLIPFFDVSRSCDRMANENKKTYRQKKYPWESPYFHGK